MIIAAAFQAVAAPAAAPQAADRGVTAYPPSFFADAQPVSAYDMVIRLPGFTFDKGAQVRGLAGAGGNVYIDGQPPVSKNDSLDEILKRIPATSVERVELIRGGAPGIDMEGRSVLANIVRKQTSGFRGAVSPSTNLIYDGRVLNSLRVEAQWRWAGGQSAEFAQVYGKGPNDELGDGHRTRYNADDTVRLRSDVDADSGGQRIWTTGAYETPLAGGRLRLNGALLFTPSYVELYDRIQGGGLEFEYDRVDKKVIELGSRYSRRLSDKLALEAIALRQDNRTNTYVRFEAPGLMRNFRLHREGDETTGRVTFKLRQSESLSFEFSGEGALNRLDSATLLTVNTRPVPVPAANVHVEELRGELTGRGTWEATRTLTLEAGVRQEKSRVTSEGDVVLENNLAFTKPRAAATWNPTKDDQVRLRIEREVGQLNFDDFVAGSGVASTGVLTVGNPDLKPQQAWVYEAVYERRFWAGGSVVVTLRHSDLSDVVDRVPVFAMGPNGALIPVADAPGNIGSGTKDEALLSVTVPLEKLGVQGAQFRGTVGRHRTRVTDPVTGVKREVSVTKPADAPREPTNNSPLTWDVHYTQDLPKLKSVWGLDVTGAYRESAYRLSEIETKKVSTTMLGFFEWKPEPTLTLRLEAQTFNQRNVKRIREVYLGSRANDRLDYTDVRDLEWGGSLLIRLRKSWG